MVSSNPNDPLFDPIRQKWVQQTPEELIRQAVLHRLVNELGYPRSWIAVEKELQQLPLNSDLSWQKPPKRRIDILVFVKATPHAPLIPLLVIECKALPLTPKFARQVIGYNAFIGAPYLSLVNATQALTGFFNREANHYRFTAGIPAFQDLQKSTDL